MRHCRCAWSLLAVFFLVVAWPAIGWGQGRPAIVAEILADRRPDMSDPAERARVVEAIRNREEARKAAAVERANARGLPLRVVSPDGQVAEIMDFEDDRPLYAVTTNREAAISTAADVTQSDLGVNGSGFTVGVWDAGAVRASHQEFVGRVNIIDNVSAVTHATHVAGTIGAAGVTARAQGMSPAVYIDSYDWNSDKSEMTSRGASYPGEPGAIYISNHSYGYRSGWAWTDRWEWFGQGTTQTAVEGNFGKYNSFARDMDSLAHSLPYYLTFWAAGNDGSDNPPEGSTVRLGGNLVTYNSSVHPPGDGVYKNGGYDTIGFESLAKNVMTVGSVNDAVTFGLRDLTKATISNFSSWGPTDDGRIKPDIVANGASVYSTTAGSNTAYGNSSGTSMAAPNAAGSAQLLASYFDQLFPGHRLRASTLKGLIIHTADDLGTPGPDYRFGWGLMNTRAAADQIAAHSTSSGSNRIVEAQLTTSDPVQTYTFTWDGVSPIRATLAWTDPAGAATTSHDNRTRRLVNNLDLVIQGPTGTIHQPYVMPYVGNWSNQALSAAAVPGKNNTDNVEQVFIQSPPAAGVYTAKVTVDGALANNAQYYSLIISGSDATEAAPPQLSSISPDSASSSVTTMTLLGAGFQLGANISLRLPGEPAREGFSHVVIPGRITARIDTGGMAGGLWDVVVTNPDGQQHILPAAFAVAAPLWSENFEGDTSGWSSHADPGSTSWAVTAGTSRSGSHSFYAPGPSTNTIDNLYSPVLDIPGDASDLSLTFWHSYQFSSNDGGVIEFSLNGGSWFDPTASGSGASFAGGGYNGSLSGSGNPNLRNPLGTRGAWTGSKTGFSEVAINLDSSAYAGKKLQIRWRLATNNQLASPGWHLDDVVLQGAGTMSIPVPQIVTAPSASEAPATGVAVDLAVEAENSDGTSGLIYTWTVNDSFDYPVSFEDNGTETANVTTATFSRAGSYLFKVTVRNAFNQSVSSELELEVIPTATSIRVSPESASVTTGGEFEFVASVLDQFELPLDPQPAVEWAVDSAAGSVSDQGLFTAAQEAGGPFQLVASALGLSGTAEIMIEALNFTAWQKVHFTAEELDDPEISGDLADPDHDGVHNLLEYALGGNPREPGRELLPQTVLEQTPEGIHLILTFSRPAGLPDLNYAVSASGDLINWPLVPIENWEIESNGETETVTVREPVGENPARFLRLEVERQ